MELLRERLFNLYSTAGRVFWGYNKDEGDTQDLKTQKVEKIFKIQINEIGSGYYDELSICN